MITECWNGWCIAGDCNGVDHVDVTGYTWSEARESERSEADTDGYGNDF